MVRLGISLSDAPSLLFLGVQLVFLCWATFLGQVEAWMVAAVLLVGLPMAVEALIKPSRPELKKTKPFSSIARSPRRIGLGLLAGLLILSLFIVMWPLPMTMALTIYGILLWSVVLGKIVWIRRGSADAGEVSTE